MMKDYNTIRCDYSFTYRISFFFVMPISVISDKNNDSLHEHQKRVKRLLKFNVAYISINLLR